LEFENLKSEFNKFKKESDYVTESLKFEKKEKESEKNIKNKKLSGH